MAPGSTINSSGSLARLKSAQAEVGASQQRLLEVIAECEREGSWLADGCRDFAHWISAQLGISNWSARRWVAASEALPRLPQVRSALGSGALSIDKVLELSRYATPETEGRLIAWAKRVTPATIRRAADVANAPDREEAIESDKSRHLDYWWTDDGRRLWLEGSWPSDQGAVIEKALDRMAGRLPDIVDDEEDAEPPSFGTSLEMRRADALVALASHRIAEDADADRATVVVHVDAETLGADHGGAEIEGGGVTGAETARRLACDGRIEFAFHDCCGRTDRRRPGDAHAACVVGAATCAAEIEVARSRAATLAGSFTPTTSGIGARVDLPISTTSCSSARFITSSCTNTDGTSNWTRGMS